MDYSIKNIRKDEKGFTLVELAVVMIIIGLLIGGILKGQELITNARITSTIGQMEGIGAAYNDFRNQFNALPGDMRDAQTRIAGCAAMASCVNGGGDGSLGVGVGGAAAGEAVGFFGMLLSAGYITGMDGSVAPGAAALGASNPVASIGGGFLVGDTGTASVGFPAVANIRNGTYLVANGSVALVAGGTGIITGQQAESIDRRLDDGNASTGSVLGDASAGCNAAGVYNSVAQGSVCALAYRL